MSDFRRKLAEFFDAENRRDWDNYREFLHPQVEWVLEEDVIKGRERYCETIVAAYAQSASRFRTHQMLEWRGGEGRPRLTDLGRGRSRRRAGGKGLGVTILLSTYNGEQFLAEQIESIQAQTYRD